MIYCKDLCHNSFPLYRKEEKHPLLPSSSHGQCLVKCTWLFCLLPWPVQMTWRSIIVICEITGPQTDNASPHNTSWNFWSKFPIWGSFGLTESPPPSKANVYSFSALLPFREDSVFVLTQWRMCSCFQTAFHKVPHQKSRSSERDWGLRKQENRMDINVHKMDWMLAKGQMGVWS